MKPTEYSLSTSFSVGFSGKECDYLELEQQSNKLTLSSLINIPLVDQASIGTSNFGIEQFKNIDFWFNNSSLEFKDYYSFQESEINETIKFISKRKLESFLNWIHQPIIDIFGDVEKELTLSKCWDGIDYHLILTIYSSLEDMDELTRLEEQLFENLNSYPEIDHALSHVVIAQR